MHYSVVSHPLFSVPYESSSERDKTSQHRPGLQILGYKFASNNLHYLSTQ